MKIGERNIITVFKGNGFAIEREGNDFRISWEEGPYGEIVSYSISEENVQKAMKSDEDAYEVKIFLETGKWPEKSADSLEKDREFIRKFPGLLLKVPENRKLFTAEELEVLLERAKYDHN